MNTSYYIGHKVKLFFSLLGLLAFVTLKVNAQTAGFIKVSTANPLYFSTSSGTFWMPVEMNYPIWINHDVQTTLNDTENAFRTFATNGGTSVRIWVRTPFLDAENKKIGVYDPEEFRRLAQVVQLAKKYKLRLKVSLESSRSFGSDYFGKKLYGTNQGGPFANFADYVNSQRGQSLYLNRAKAYITPYNNDPAVYCWELWNEMNVISQGNWYDFTRTMLSQVKQLAPHQLVSQTLGSMAYKGFLNDYIRYLKLGNNDISCLHQYLDPAAELDICRAPVDEMLARSIDFMHSNGPGRLIFVNETGAVEPNSVGMSHYYDSDSSGMLLHDMLFTPFFCGAAGPGSFWIYEPYIIKKNLWYHYKRFSNAVKGFNPLVEKPRVSRFAEQGTKFYMLRGTSTALIWCRDAGNTYITELGNGIKPAIRKGVVFDLLKTGSGKVYKTASAYNPWTDTWQKLSIVNNKVQLPAFTRSVVLKLR